MTSPSPVSKDQRVGELHPAPYNPRSISAEGLENLGQSIREFGDISGVVYNIRTNHLVGGHQRVKILDASTVAIGHIETPWGPFAYREVEWPIEREIAANISANKARSDWDAVKLTPLLVQVDSGDIGLNLTGFSESDLKTMGDATILRNEKEVPPVPKKPITKSGDLWTLGRHRLACGDSVDPKIVKRLIGGEGVDALLTDPPYCSGGFQESGKAQGSVGTASKKYSRAGKIHNDTLSTRGYRALIHSALDNFQARMVYVFTDWRMWVHLFDTVESKGYGVRSMIVWDKGTPGMGMGWRAQHELVMLGTRSTIKFDGHKSSGNVIQSQRTGNVNHTTEKPIELLEKIIGVTPAETFGDPFIGSGSTLIACERSGRTCYGIEMSAGYCDVVVERWESLTGEKAKRG